jgi:hypothetical protein
MYIATRATAWVAPGERGIKGERKDDNPEDNFQANRKPPMVASSDMASPENPLEAPFMQKVTMISTKRRAAPTASVNKDHSPLPFPSSGFRPTLSKRRA